eukprot:gene28203-34056_t
MLLTIAILGISCFAGASAWLQGWVAKQVVASSWLLQGTFLPTREQTQPLLNIPAAISKYHPLPQEELLVAYSRGNSYLVSGKFDEALREFDRALEVSPNNADVFVSRGIAEEKLLKWDQAIEDYRKANTILKSRPFGSDDATCMSNIANAETGLGKWTDALRDFNYAIKLKPDFVAPQIGKALVLYQLDNREESWKIFSDMSDTYPDFPDGLAATAVISWDLHKPGYEDMWQDAIKLDDRYQDVSWVRDIRRWSPKLVETLESFLTNYKKV